MCALWVQVLAAEVWCDLRRTVPSQEVFGSIENGCHTKFGDGHSTFVHGYVIGRQNKDSD